MIYMLYTSNYGLKKPEDGDFGSNEDFNYNADVIDAKLKTLTDADTTNANNIAALKTIRTATITTTWSGTSAPYTQTVSVPGITASDTPIICPVYSTTNQTAVAQKKAWNLIGKIITNAGSITITCFEEKPVTAIPIQIKGV